MKGRAAGMFASPSSNVIIAKARAMYGNCLKAQNFTELLACRSVGEIASYLKNHTAYAAVLSDINEATIHRGHLEMLLRRKLFNDYASLSRYDLTTNTHLSEYIIQNGEVDQIIHCLRLMSAGRTSDFFFSLPMFFTSHSHLDYIGMSHAKNYGELVAVMERTPYHDILALYPPGEDGRIRLTEIENALQTRIVNTLYSSIGKTSGDMRRQLVNLCGAQVDAQNVSRIIRLKRYFHASPDHIRANLLPYGGAISKRQMEQMIDASSAEEVASIFYSTSIGRQIPAEQRPFVHDIYLRAPYYNARHHIHFSSYAMVVMVSYMILTEVELDDIINIIEGVRYGLPVDQIKPMLVLIEH